MTDIEFIRGHLFQWAGRPRILLEVSEAVELLEKSKGVVSAAKKPGSVTQGRPPGSTKKYIKTVVHQRTEPEKPVENTPR